MRLGVGEKHQGKGADGGDGHEEVLVQAVSAGDVAHGFDEHVVAGDEVRNEEEDELGVEGARVAERALKYAGKLQAEGDGEQYERNYDAVAPPLLLLVHGASVQRYCGSVLSVLVLLGGG